MAQLRGTKIYGDLAVLPGSGSDSGQLGSASIAKDLTVGGKLIVTGSTELAENLLVKGNAVVSGSQTVKDDATFEKDVKVKGNLVVDKKIVVNNDLEVKGNLTYIDTENLRVKDQRIELNTDGSGSAAIDPLTLPAGIDILGAVSGTTASILYDPDGDKFTLNKRLEAAVTLENKISFDATSSEVTITPEHGAIKEEYTRDENTIKNRIKVVSADNTGKEFNGSQDVKVIVDFTDIDERIDRLVMQKDVEHVMTTGDTMTGDLYMKTEDGDHKPQPNLNTGVVFDGKAKIVLTNGELQFLFGSFNEPDQPSVE